MLEYISESEYIKRGYPQNEIANFDCGTDAFNDFLQNARSLWRDNYAGITYFLVDNDVDRLTDIRIYAYAVLSTAGLLEAGNDSDYKYVSSIEIKLFAIHKKFRNCYDSYGNKYSNIFFAILMQDLWSMAISKVSFKTIFLQSNDVGKALYEHFGFLEMSDYIAPTTDDKIEVDDCTPMICFLSDEMLDLVFDFT